MSHFQQFFLQPFHQILITNFQNIPPKVLFGKPRLVKCVPLNSTIRQHRLSKGFFGRGLQKCLCMTVSSEVIKGGQTGLFRVSNHQNYFVITISLCDFKTELPNFLPERLYLQGNYAKVSNYIFGTPLTFLLLQF